MKNKYDVIVIGGGPAGSVAAKFASENGASVLLLERDREAGIPVRCAEGVSLKGIAPFIEIDKRWIAAQIDVATLFAPNGESAKMHNNGTGLVLERRIFDTALCEEAVKFGVEFVTKADAIDLTWKNGKISGVKINYLNEILEIECDVVIGADGVESRVGRWAGIKTNVALKDIDTCIQYTLSGIDIEENACEFYFGRDVSPGGYVWVFPKNKNTANVGIGLAGHFSHAKGPKKFLDEFIQKRFPNGQKIYTVCGGVTTADTLPEIVHDNIMLVGDAARQVNPITGGGIVQGMIAGSIAGKVAAEAVQKKKFNKKFLKKYRKEWDKKIGNNQKVMYKIKEKVLEMGDEKFNSLVKICQNIPADKFTVKALFSEAVKDDPRLVLEIAKTFVKSKLKLK